MRKRIYFTAILQIVIFLKVIPQPGTLDSEFGFGGIVTTLFNNDTVTCFSGAIAIQNDGKIVVAGFAEINEKYMIAVFRYHHDGSLDNSFGVNGLTLSILGDNIVCYARDVAIQDDGKILVAGEVYDGTRSDFAVSRYHTDGSPDPEFGTDGFVITPLSTSLGTGSGEVSSMAVQDDGKILVAGSINLQGGRQIALVRYYQNGFQDNTFGDNGIVTKSVGEWVHANSISIQQNGRIVVGGRALSSTFDPSFAMIRFRSDGTVDNSFGSSGVVIASIGENSGISALNVQNDGKIIVAGNSYSLGEYNIIVARYHKNGEIDSTFGPEGMVNTNAADLHGTARSLAIQDNGKILVAGQTSLAEFAIVCLDSSGIFDEAFGDDGIFILSGLPDSYFGSSVALTEEGNIILSGTVYTVKDDYFIVLAGLNPKGKLLNTFGKNGMVLTPVGTDSYIAQSLALQEDGKIIVSGYCSITSGSDFITARYNRDGTIDQSFGSSGSIIEDISPALDIVNNMVIQRDGKIVVAGYSTDSIGYYDCTLVRYDTDGKRDITFGNDGIVIASLGPYYDWASDMDIRDDGKIIVAGTIYNGHDYDFVLMQLDDLGNSDGTFGINGKVITSIDTLNDVTYDLELQQDGKIIVSGYSQSEEGHHPVLVRYLPDGSLDNTFGMEGIVSITGETVFEGSQLIIILQPDGRIVAGTTSYNGNDLDFWLCRLDHDGTYDDSFGLNGIVSKDLGMGTHESVTSLTQCILANGEVKIIASGYTYSGNNTDFAVVAYNPDGSTDPDFNAVTSFGSSLSYSYSSAVQDDGKVLLAGIATDARNLSVFALARYSGFTDASSPPLTSTLTRANINPGASLGQNYPNPFSNFTVIGWNVFESNHVALRVYDILGNEVATLSDGIHMPGEYEVNFNNQGLSEGLYYYTLTVDEIPVETKKMVLLR